jgi:AcrR family transcriptional regulator
MKQANEISILTSKRPNTRDKILAEATRQFNSQGYYDTRLEDIAKALDTVKTSISYHFRSKESLLFDVYSHACDFSELALQQAHRKENGLERVIAYIRSHLEEHDRAARGIGPPLGLTNDLSGLNSTHQALVGDRYQGLIRGFQTFVTEGLADGSIDVQSVEASTFFAFNVIQSAPSWMDEIPEKSRQIAFDGCFDLLRNGLCNMSMRPVSKPISRTQTTVMSDIFDREARNRLKREAILKTGIRHLNRTGYRQLSLEDIASELGVTRGAFYYHIDDKETLLVECFDRTCNLIEKALELANLYDSDSAALQHLERAVRWLFEGHVTELEPLLRLNLSHLLSKPRQAALGARLRRLRASIAEQLAKGMLDGSIRDINVEASEYIIFGSVFAASGRRFAATQLHETWQPHMEPVSASAAYFEPLITGFGA